MLQKEFKNVRFTEDELENFELATQNNVELSYYCTPYYYTLARVLVVTKNEEYKAARVFTQERIVQLKAA